MEKKIASVSYLWAGQKGSPICILQKGEPLLMVLLFIEYQGYICMNGSPFSRKNI